MTETSKMNTPMLRQYQAIKEGHEDAILFFRLGDFYEMFLDDAKTASRELELTLTGRGKDDNRIPMCGIPYHAADNYIPRLVNRGYKVAICEQVEEATEGPGITKREVVKIITPGTISGEGQLEAADNNYLLAVQPLNPGFGCAYADSSTGEFRCLVVDTELGLKGLIEKLGVRELLLPYDTNLPFDPGVLVSHEPFMSNTVSESELTRHFQLKSLQGFGVTEAKASFPAAWAVLLYLKATQKNALAQIIKLSPLPTHNSMMMDPVTFKNLELITPLHPGGKTLFDILNHTRTAMGARKLKQAIKSPLLLEKQINQRLDAVESLKADLLSREEIREKCQKIYDIERLISRIVSGHNQPKDCVALKQSLQACLDFEPILTHLEGDIFKTYSTFFKLLNQEGSIYQELILLLDRAIEDPPPLSVSEGNCIKPGFDDELDALRASFKDIKDWILNLEPSEREKTGIKSLKVGFNKVFGYYLEISNANKTEVPESYIRKQTLTNAERYITPELKEKENILLHGEGKQSALEQTIYQSVVREISSQIEPLQQLAEIIADMDFLQSLASAAQKYNYTRPTFVDPKLKKLKLKKGRHPVLEQNPDLHFIANDIHLGEDEHLFGLITGPNMAGKSTFMRQLALITIMAQIGAFIPADAGEFSIIDQLFTRIGALDNLYLGQSTYMVEMVETASILNTATENSLIILDEIGRGTATYDGMSIAWAITEYIHNQVGARTLFATHYHELTTLETSLKQLRNYRLKITETADTIVFNYLLELGPADKSYGVHVAKMAGLPQSIIDKAEHLLEQFEVEGLGYIKDKAADVKQMSLF